jgi:ABC-type iron transport system FetAB permease component
MTSREPVGERLKALETEMAAMKADAERSLQTITKANEDHFISFRNMTTTLSNHITAETNRWLKAFYWIAFALMTVGGTTLGNTKLTEKIFEAIFK